MFAAFRSASEWRTWVVMEPPRGGGVDSWASTCNALVDIRVVPKNTSSPGSQVPWEACTLVQRRSRAQRRSCKARTGFTEFGLDDCVVGMSGSFCCRFSCAWFRFLRTAFCLYARLGSILFCGGPGVVDLHWWGVVFAAVLLVSLVAFLQSFVFLSWELLADQGELGWSVERSRMLSSSMFAWL